MLTNSHDGYLNIPEATARLLSGNVVIFPTDTVWDVGALWRSQRGVDKLYQVTQRPADDPLAILVGDVEQLEELGLDYNALSPQMHRAMAKLMHEFWPGGVTLVLPWPNKPSFYGWPQMNLGVRVPNHEVTRTLIKNAGPILQASANVAGGLPPAAYDAIDPHFSDLTGGVLAGESDGQAASTVVDVTGSELRIVQAGCVPVVEIERALYS